MRLYGNIEHFVKNTLYFILSSHALLFPETVPGWWSGFWYRQGAVNSPISEHYIFVLQGEHFQVKTSAASCEYIIYIRTLTNIPYRLY